MPDLSPPDIPPIGSDPNDFGTQPLDQYGYPISGVDPYNPMGYLQRYNPNYGQLFDTNYSDLPGNGPFGGNYSEGNPGGNEGPYFPPTNTYDTNANYPAPGFNQDPWHPNYFGGPLGALGQLLRHLFERQWRNREIRNNAS